ncbi:MAG TPA: hypothetical protein VGC91_13080 [Pyrinomonadaceae bacterium]
MTKKDVIWLLIRISGLYFILQGIESLLGLWASLITVNNSPGMLKNSAGVLLQSFLLTAIYFSFGIYMVSNGSFFYRLLSRQPDSDD